MRGSLRLHQRDGRVVTIEVDVPDASDVLATEDMELHLQEDDVVINLRVELESVSEIREVRLPDNVSGRAQIQKLGCLRTTVCQGLPDDEVAYLLMIAAPSGLTDWDIANGHVRVR